MFDTLEMRWFFERLPLDASRQFSRPDEAEQRTDWYSMPCNPRCGVKLREGKLEIKLQTASLGERQHGPLAGRVEAWRKWSLNLPPEKGPSPAELSAVDWLDVQKRRRLERYYIEGSKIESTENRPESGCEFEMTELTVGGRQYWTVGFESFGPSGSLESNLSRTIDYVVARGGFITPFAIEDSKGYAAWLAGIQLERGGLSGPN